MAGRLIAVEDRIRLEYERVRAGVGDDGVDAGLRQLYIDAGEVAERLEDLDRQAERLDEARLQGLVDDFGLDEFERDVLVSCVLAELDPGSGRVYGYLQDDMSRRSPTVGLLLRLFADDESRRAAFHPTAPLMHHGLVRLTGLAESSLGAMVVVVDERIVSHLLGCDGIDSRLAPWTQVEAEPIPRLLTERQFTSVVDLAHAGAQATVLVGSGGEGRREAARLYAHLLDAPLLVIDVPTLLGCPVCHPREAVRLVVREALLESAVVYWDGGEEFWGDDERAPGARRSLEAELRTAAVVCLFGARPGWEPPPMFVGQPFRVYTLPAPTSDERWQAWTGALSEAGVDVEPIAGDITALALAFRLTVPQIADAVAVALAAAGPDGAPSGRDLRAGARAVSGRGLAALSTEIVPKASWDHLVLHQDAVDQLGELCSTVLHHS
ncbi:MAG: hypothetical protein ACHQNA_11640, partial [Acidimicrobiales bacterium]